MIRHTRLLLWRTLAAVSLLLGIVGVVIPGLPTVPFLLLAAWAAGRGWPELEAWLLEHPTHGPTIRRWREQGAVPRRAKWLATAMMCVSALALAWAPVPDALRWAVWAILAAVALWLWRRPEA